jgi:hypothetical protein
MVGIPVPLAHFPPRIVLLLGGERRKNDAGEAYIF